MGFNDTTLNDQSEPTAVAPYELGDTTMLAGVQHDLEPAMPTISKRLMTAMTPTIPTKPTTMSCSMCPSTRRVPARRGGQSIGAEYWESELTQEENGYFRYHANSDAFENGRTLHGHDIRPTRMRPSPRPNDSKGRSSRAPSTHLPRCWTRSSRVWSTSRSAASPASVRRAAHRNGRRREVPPARR